MSSSRNVPMRPVEVTSSSSVVGQLLGDSLMGSCWRAVEQAVQPDVEVRVYVRSFVEANLALDIICRLASTRGILKLDVAKKETTVEAKELNAAVAISMNNGSVIVLKQETRKNR